MYFSHLEVGDRFYWADGRTGTASNVYVKVSETQYGAEREDGSRDVLGNARPCPVVRVR